MEIELSTIRFHQHRNFVQFQLKSCLLFLNRTAHLNLYYWHKHSDKRFLVLGHVISPAWATNSTYCATRGTWDFSAETQMWRVGTCHDNVHDLTLEGEERWKPLCCKCSPVFISESCSPSAQWSITGVPSLHRKSSPRTAGFFPSWTVVRHVVWNSHSHWR